MAAYEPPVSRLVQLGRPDVREDWDDYSTFGIGPEHVPELIRLAQDEELARADSEPEVYAPIHAWRALGQLRAEAAVEPLLDLLAEQEDDEKWSDWVTEEVPLVLGMIGPAALPAVAARMEQQGPPTKFVQGYFAGALTEIAKRHPETRDEVIRHLCRVLETAAVNDPSANGCVVGDLLDLRATEAWPAIERAFATGNVDEFTAGDAAHVKWELGLGPKPVKPRRHSLLPGLVGGRNPRERAADRARQRKAEKRKKRRRKRK